MWGLKKYAYQLLECKGITKFTLEKTPGGKWMDALKLYDKLSDGMFKYESLGLNKSQAVNLWNTLSGRYADGVSGAVTAFVKNVPDAIKPKTVFYSTEFPKLRFNDMVTHIVAGKETNNGKKFTVAVQGDSNIIYQANSCIAQVVAADFRDECWYIGMGKVINKKTMEQSKLTLMQMKILIQRISFELHQELYSDQLQIIICNDKNTVYDNFVELLEVSE